MNTHHVIDARGLSCPEPALLAERALREGAEGRLEILVDTPTAVDNITRLATRAGWAVLSEGEASGGTRLVLTR